MYKSRKVGSNEIELIDMNVYEASKKRIKKMINIHDNIAISFTGGKDSTVVLYLVDECMKELKRKDKVKVLFSDEEFVPKETLDFVDGLVKSNKYDFYYYCLPTIATAQLLGKEKEYIQWDINKEHKRKPPKYAITSENLGNIIIKDSIIDKYKLLANDIKGNICIFNGYRVGESFNVFKGMINNKGNYYNKSKISTRITICKPIYDWKVEDVFLYFLKNNLPYNPIYNYFMWSGLPLRSSIPLDKEASKNLEKYRVYDPNYYDLLISEFPELDSSAKYNNVISAYKIGMEYGNNFKGLIKYVNEKYDNKNKKKFLLELKNIYKYRKKNENENDLLAYYPILHLYECLIYGKTLDYKKNYSLKDFIFEGYTEDDYLKWKGENND